MREILFRGKRFDDNTWIYGSLLENDIIVTKGATDVDEDYIGFSGEWSSVLPETVSQYTGLTDKNGVKIFEGDIVREHRICDKPNKHTTYTVIFIRHMFVVETDNCSISLCSITVDSELEVVGNIYDNEVQG